MTNEFFCSQKLFGPLRNRYLGKLLQEDASARRRQYRRVLISDVDSFSCGRAITKPKNPQAWKESLFRSLAALQDERVLIEKRRQKARQIYQQSRSKSQVDVFAAEKSNPQIPPIGDEMVMTIKEAFRNQPGQVLVDVSRQAVTRSDLETLLGLNWLNDAIINVYLNLIVNRSKEKPSLPKVYAFNTFFLTRYIEMGYSAVRRWTRRDDIFAHDILLVPVHLGMHWCMAIVDLRVKQIKYMDSMGGRNDECLGTLLDYLAQELEDKKKSQLNFDEWQLSNIQNLPQQQNGSDCGMFALKYADYGAQDAEINFSQSDMPYFRRRMMFEILQSAILPTGYGES